MVRLCFASLAISLSDGPHEVNKINIGPMSINRNNIFIAKQYNIFQIITNLIVDCRILEYNEYYGDYSILVMKKTFDFPGFKDDLEVGSVYKNRAEVLEAGLHNNIQSGICARKNEKYYSANFSNFNCRLCTTSPSKKRG